MIRGSCFENEDRIPGVLLSRIEVGFGICRGPQFCNAVRIYSAINLPLAGERMIDERVHHEYGVETDQ